MRGCMGNRSSSTRRGNHGWFGLLCLAFVPLTSCMEIPPDYSPHYTYVPVASANPRDRRPHYIVVPEACLTPDPTSDTWTIGGPILPPGCANAYDLQRMVERERDLFRGRQMGAAPAAPTVRAANKYLYGDQGARSEPPPAQTQSKSGSASGLSTTH